MDNTCRRLESKKMEESKVFFSVTFSVFYSISSMDPPFPQTIPSLMIPATNWDSDQTDCIIVLFLFRWSWFLPLVIPAHPSVPSIPKVGRIFLLLPISGLFHSWLLSFSITCKANFLLYFPSVKSVRVVFMAFAEMWLNTQTIYLFGE